MQRIRTILLLFIAAATVFLACRKELPSTTGARAESPGSQKADVTACLKDVATACGMLKFATWGEFEDTRACLQAAYEAHIDAFDNLYGNLDEDDYNNVVDQLGFTEDQPLIEFEDALNHNSHRRHLASLEAAWPGCRGRPI